MENYDPFPLKTLYKNIHTKEWTFNRQVISVCYLNLKYHFEYCLTPVESERQSLTDIV